MSFVHILAILNFPASDIANNLSRVDVRYTSEKGKF